MSPQHENRPIHALRVQNQHSQTRSNRIRQHGEAEREHNSEWPIESTLSMCSLSFPKRCSQPTGDHRPPNNKGCPRKPHIQHVTCEKQPSVLLRSLMRMREPQCSVARCDFEEELRVDGCKLLPRLHANGVEVNAAAGQNDFHRILMRHREAIGAR
ncbi:hypothetical protein SAMN05518847_107313 [Paenibacillus sp. OV219]|nr:hypothetical protein SAMN05518847_107313 [Paenibacillus sp. OV219]